MNLLLKHHAEISTAPSSTSSDPSPSTSSTPSLSASPVSRSSTPNSEKKRKKKRSVDENELAGAIAEKNAMLQSFLTHNEERRASMDSYMKVCLSKEELQ